MRLDRSLRGLLDRTVDGTFLGPVRVSLGLMLLFQGAVAARELTTQGYFGDAFHLSLLPEALVPSRSLYVGLIALRCVLASLVVVGARAREALAASAFLVFYTLSINTLDYHHNRYALACYALLLSLTPCDRWLAPATPRAAGAARVGLAWGVNLCQAQVCLVYLASGGAKLFDPDWRSGAVLHERLAWYAPVAEARGVPHGLLAALSAPLAASALAKLVVITELSLPALLASRRTRAAALAWGVWFHLLIQLTSRVELFGVLTLTMYGVFVTGDVRARALRYDPRSRAAATLATVVRATDWFARFDVRPWEADAVDARRHVVVVRRDGSRATRLAALAMLARGLPVFFPLWAPLALTVSLGRGPDVATEA